MKTCRSLSLSNLSFIFSQLQVLSRSGISLSQSMKVLAHDIPNKAQQLRLREAIYAMEQGQAFSKAMEQSGIFPVLACSIIRAGEQSGQLEDMCGLLSTYYQKLYMQRQLLQQALAYPVFLLICTMTMFFGAVFWVLPVFAEMFQEMGVPLPAATSRLLGMAQFLRNHMLSITGSMAGSGAGILFLLRHGSRRQALMRMVCTSAMGKPLCLAYCWQQFSQILAIQLRSGIPVLDGIRDASQAVRLVWFRNEMRYVSRYVSQGISISQAMGRRNLTTPYITMLLIVGETTGSYDEALQYINEYYSIRLMRWLTRFQQVIGPVLLLVAGCAIGLLIICLLLPLLEMVSGAGRI